MMNNDYMNGKTFRSEKTLRDEMPGSENRSSRMDNPTAESYPSSGDGKAEKSRFQIGDVLLDKYVITAALGQGGMGVVYKCFDKVGGVEVAVKMVPPELSRSAVDMEDVRDNFQFVTKLVHQHIAISKNLERDPATGDYYLIMECVEGEDLRRWIRRKQRAHALNLETILPVVRQIADALDYAHAQNVIHRDVKPANVMISIDGFVKVLDFGLAAKIHTSLSQLTMGNRRKSGTAPYMSPEQWRGHPQEGAADQYALAVMVYEMLAGHLPFENPDMEALRFAVLNDKPRELKNQPAHVCAAIDRAMSKNPDDRFETCADFVAALAGGKVKTKKNARDQKSFSRGGAIAAALAGLLLIGGGVFLYQNQRHAEKQAVIVVEQKRGEGERRAAENKAIEEKRLLAEKERAEREKKDLDTLISENLNHFSGLQYAQDTLKMDEMDQGQTFGDKIRTFKIKFEVGKRAQEKEGLQYQRIANQNFAEAKNAVDWIVKNTPLRKTAQALLATIEAKKKSADEFDASNLASNFYNKASIGITKGKLAYEQGDFASAIQGLKEGIADYETAGLTARKTKLGNLEVEIKAAQNEKNWSKVKELAEKMQRWDAVKAKTVIDDADLQLKREEIERLLAQAQKAKEREDWEQVSQLTGRILKLDAQHAQAAKLQEEAEGQLITNDEQLKKYLLARCDAIKKPDWGQKEAKRNIEDFDFKDFKKYKERASLIADCILLGSSVTVVRYLVEKHGLSATATYGWINQTPLHDAAMKSNSEMIKFLVGLGADVNAKNTVPQTPLELLVAQNDANIDTIAFLIEKGADVKFKDKEGKSLADKAPSFKVLQLLLQKGAVLSDPNDLYRKAVRNKEMTFIRENCETIKKVEDIMCSAVATGDLAFLKYFENLGCSYSIKTKDEATVLLCAINKKTTLPFFEYILSKEPNALEVADKDGWTPLMRIAQYGHLDILKHAVKLGSDIHRKNDTLQTALSFAASSGFVDVVKYLVSKGATVDVKNKRDHTPLTLALYNDDNTMMKCLIECGANINQQNKNGWTPIMMAVGRGNIEQVKLLIDKGANVNVNSSTSGWETPLMAAVGGKEFEIVKILVKANADIKFKDKEGRTAISIAPKDSEVRKYLINHLFNENETEEAKRQVNDVEMPEYIRNGYFAEAKSGVVESMLKMGEIYYEGKEVKKDGEKAVKWYTKAALEGSVRAKYELGNLYNREKQYALAAQWYQKGADDDDWAAYNLGELYMEGLGVKRNYGMAYMYLKKASENGNTFANAHLGKINMCGLGRKINYEEALKYFEKADTSDSAIKLAEVKECLEFAKNPNCDWLFPVYGVMPGRITESELKGLSSKKSGTEYYVNDLGFYWEQGRVDRVMLANVNSHKWPGQWHYLGYNPAYSFNEWCAFLKRKGYQITIKSPAKQVLYQGNLCFNAELRASRNYPVRHDIDLDFSFLPNATADDRDTLYSFYIRFR